ncbi:antA/AntB antirepressor family protein [Fusobacterium polymorphum]
MKKISIKDSITSLELVEEINKFRKEENNKNKLLHKNLLTIIRDEFEEEISQLKIQPSTYISSRGKEYPLFILTLNQAKQVLMRESKYVRRAMIHYIEKLEQALIKSVNKEIELDNPRLYYEELIIEQVKGFLTKDGKKYELGVLAVSARQLWTKLEVKTYFTDWIKRRLERYNYQEDIDYIWYGDDYALTLDMASELSLIENTEIGRKLRSYIVNYEREYKKDEYEKQEELNDRIAMLEKIVLIPNSKNSTLTKDYTSIENMNGNLKTINYINDLIKEDFKAIQKIFNKIVSKEAEKALYIRQLENIVNSKI